MGGSMRALGIPARAVGLQVCLLAALGAAGTIFTLLMASTRRTYGGLRLIALAMLLPFALGIGEPRAEDESVEARLAQLRQSHPTDSVLMFKLTLFDVENKREDYCFNRYAHFTSSDGRTVRVQVVSGFRFREPPRYKEAMFLIAPGTWVLDAISCEATRTNLKGQFASITINNGEVISGGHLIVNYAMGAFLSLKYSSRQEVKDFDAETIASLKRRLPVTFAKAKKRNLTSINKPSGA